MSPALLGFLGGLFIGAPIGWSLIAAFGPRGESEAVVALTKENERLRSMLRGLLATPDTPTTPVNGRGV